MKRSRPLASSPGAAAYDGSAVLPVPSSAAPRREALQAAKLLKALVRDLFYVEDKSSNLPVRQLKVCALLYDNPRTMSEIARELGVTQSAMTQIIDRVERGGLVARSASVADRRVKSISLTPRGKRMLRERDESRVSRIEEVLARMAEDDRRAAVQALQSLAAACAVTNPSTPHES